jgi:hypothetical protein
MSEAFQDIGPTAPLRWRVYEIAREIEAMAKIAVELSGKGPHADVARAQRQLDRIRAVLGDAQ